MSIKSLSLLLLTTLTSFAWANISIPMYSTDNPNVSLGTVEAEQTPYGVLFIPHLQNLTAGIHGFHIHENPNCGDKGMSAGGHLDPAKTGKHLGPYNNAGHLGDLPVLIVNQDGTATLPLLAPRLKLQDIKNHSLMIHAGGDNYSDSPEPLGGGGARLACGIIK